jgi:predicted transcriptional regulator
MIHPYIFAGLGQPKSKLFFDIQADIAKHGGRLKLADVIESEMLKHPPRKPAKIPTIYIRKFTNSECEIIKEMRGKMPVSKIAVILGRDKDTVKAKITRLVKSGYLKAATDKFKEVPAGYFTSKEDKIIIKYLGRISYKEIGEKIGKDERAVCGRVFRLREKGILKRK